MGVIVFTTYSWKRIRKPICSNSNNQQDIGVAIALYVVYPAILWLLIEKFHGVCGPETYLQKKEAIAANNSVFLWFTFLMRTYKLATILLFQADASDKEEDSQGEEGGDDDEGCTKQKCRVWFILSQELTAIFSVAFLLLLCLPVLAFWFMFIGILISSYNIFTLLKRLWKDAHSQSDYLGDDDISIMDEVLGEGGEDGDDIELQDFLINSSEDDENNNNNNNNNNGL